MTSSTVGVFQEEDGDVALVASSVEDVAAASAAVSFDEGAIVQTEGK